MDPRIRHRYSFPLSREENKQRLLNLQCLMLEYDSTGNSSPVEVRTACNGAPSRSNVHATALSQPGICWQSQRHAPLGWIFALSLSLVVIFSGGFVGVWGERSQDSLGDDAYLHLPLQLESYTPIHVEPLAENAGNLPSVPYEDVLPFALGSAAWQINAFEETSDMMEKSGFSMSLDSATATHERGPQGRIDEINDGSDAFEKWLERHPNSDLYGDEKMESVVSYPNMDPKIESGEISQLCLKCTVLGKNDQRYLVVGMILVAMACLTFSTYARVERRNIQTLGQGAKQPREQQSILQPSENFAFEVERQSSLKSAEKYVWTQKGIDFLKSRCAWKLWVDAGRPGTFPVENGLVNGELLEQMLGNQTSDGEIATMLRLKHIVPAEGKENNKETPRKKKRNMEQELPSKKSRVV